MAKVTKSVAAFSCHQLLSRLRTQQGSQNFVLNVLLTANIALNVAESDGKPKVSDKSLAVDESLWRTHSCYFQSFNSTQQAFFRPGDIYV